MRLSHVAWSLGGLAFPLGVAVLTVPHLIYTLGQERFGLLALAWGLIGYAGALDLGLGRALTQVVSKLRGARDLYSIPDVLTTAGRITLLTGLGGAVLICAAALGGADAWVKTQSTSSGELQVSILLLAVALPAQSMSAAYRGLNEAFENFKGISLLRAALGVANFAGPYWVSLFTNQLPWLVATLVVSRLLALFVYRHLAMSCLQKHPKVRPKGDYSSTIARNLFSFGAWVTVSSVASPMLVQADRFVIASTISAAAVSVYVLPYEVIMQSLILVGAVSSVMFPGLTRLIHEQPDQWRPYFRKWLFRVTGLMALVCIALALLLPLVLPLWLKDSLQPISIEIGQVLCLGVFANAISSMFYALLHAKGRADVTAKLHLIELPIFLTSLFFLTNEFGVSGAAWAWAERMAFDAVVLAGWSNRQ